MSWENTLVLYAYLLGEKDLAALPSLRSVVAEEAKKRSPDMKGLRVVENVEASYKW